MNGSADDHVTSTIDEVAPATPLNAQGRHRAFILALRAAKLPPWKREIVAYLADHCDRDGTTYVTEKRIAKDFGYKQRSSVHEAIESARVAGLVERGNDGNRELWIIPIMRGARAAQLSEQLRGKSEDLRGARAAQAARSQSRAPSEGVLSTTRRDEPLRFERSPETVQALEEVRHQLRRKVGRER